MSHPSALPNLRCTSSGRCRRYGGTYCGCAFQVWRSRDWLPKDMVFTGGLMIMSGQGEGAPSSGWRMHGGALLPMQGLAEANSKSLLSFFPGTRPPLAVDYLGKEESNLTVNFRQVA